MINSDRFLFENGVSYTRSPELAKEVGLRLFKYERESPNGHKSDGFVYCENLTDLVKLVNYWNHSDWKYTVPLGTV